MYGRILSHYKIRKQIGSGGMGEVYLAEDTKLGRLVALKILPAEVSSNEDRLRRFEHEAKAVSALNHPNVLQIHEIAESDGIHFIVMEYLEGDTLEAKLQGHPLQTSEILNFAIQIVDALDEAHQKGVIHRDLKSPNIMVTPRNQVKVLDFGLAKFTNPAAMGSALETSPQTESGVILGTVQYMSPEQAMGKKVDHRSDIFSMGVVLYQMATGRLPFSGETSTEILSHLLNQQPEAIARLNYNVPADLERIIRKSLEKDPERRYQSSRDLLVDLKNLKRDTESSPSVTTKPIAVSHHRKIFMALALALVIVAGYFIYRNVNRGPAIHSIAILPFVNVSGDPNMEYLSDGITDTTINSLSKLHNLRVLARTTVFTYKGKVVDPRKIGQDLKVDTVVTGRIFQQDGVLTLQAELVNTSDGSQIWGEQYKRQLSEIASIQSDLSREISQNLRLKISGGDQAQVTKQYTQNTEAYQLYLRGVYLQQKITKEDTIKSIQYFQESIEKDSNYALPYTGLSQSYINLLINTWSPPGEIMVKAKPAAEKGLELGDTSAHSALAQVDFLYNWDWLGAEKEFQQAFKFDPNNSDCHDVYSLYLSAMGRGQESIAEVKRTMELNPLLRTGYAAWVFYNLRRYDDAIQYSDRIIEMNPDFGIPYQERSEAYLRKGNPKRALEDLESALKYMGRDPLVVTDLVWTYSALGKTVEARNSLQELEDRAGSEYIAPYLIASGYTALGDRDKAFEWLEKAYRGRDFWLVFLIDPWWDPIRSDPRFVDLEQRMNLPYK